jgi:hypothetical protein
LQKQFEKGHQLINFCAARERRQHSPLPIDPPTRPPPLSRPSLSDRAGGAAATAGGGATEDGDGEGGGEENSLQKHSHSSATPLTTLLTLSAFSNCFCKLFSSPPPSPSPHMLTRARIQYSQDRRYYNEIELSDLVQPGTHEDRIATGGGSSSSRAV